MLLVVLNLWLAFGTCFAAIRFGSEVERLGASVVVMMLVLNRIGTDLIARQFLAVDTVSITQDAFALGGFSLLGIYSKRIWPLWAAAFQLLSVGAHLVRALELDVRPVVYAWMKSGPTWAVLILLLIGTLGHHRRTSSSGSARSSPG